MADDVAVARGLIDAGIQVTLPQASQTALFNRAQSIALLVERPKGIRRQPGDCKAAADENMLMMINTRRSRSPTQIKLLGAFCGSAEEAKLWGPERDKTSPWPRCKNCGTKKPH